MCSSSIDFAACFCCHHHARYERPYYFWEVTVIFKKMLLTGAIVIIGQGSSAQLVAGMLIVLANMLLVLQLGPFVDRADDVLSFLGSLQMFLTLLMGLLLKTDDPNDPTYDHQFMGVILVLVNMLPFLALAVSLALLHPKVRARVNRCRATAANGEDCVENEAKTQRQKEKQQQQQQQQQKDTKVTPSAITPSAPDRKDNDDADSVRSWS
jgi:hypothetical protein